MIIRKAGKTAEFLLIVCVSVLSLVSAYFLWNRTNFGTDLLSAETRRMLLELTVVFLLLFASFRCPLKRLFSVSLRAAVIAGFLWVHQMFTPVVLTGAYIFYLLLFGRTLLEAAGCTPAAGQTEMTAEKAGADGSMIRKFFVSLLSGSAMQIIAVCIFSAFGIGGAGFFRMQVLITAMFLIAVRLIFRKRFRPLKSSLQKVLSRLASGGSECGRSISDIPDTVCGGIRFRPETVFCLLMSLIITMLLLQAGRINIARDYDSLHYSLRSAYVLDNGRGIYENLGSVNDVYMYPKGFEILTLPLSGLHSDAYVPAFSWWMTALTLICAAAIVQPTGTFPCIACGEQSSELFSALGRKQPTGTFPLGRKQPTGTLPGAGLLTAAVLSCIPGIMNMAASAKTDAVTLTFQLIGILLLTGDVAGEELRFPWAGLAAFVFTLTLKPTSFLFSFLPALAGLGFWLLRFIKERNERQKKAQDSAENIQNQAQTAIRSHKSIAGILIFVLCLLATVGVTARTVYLAGVPLTTAGLGLWQKLGFALKYPFNSLSMGDASDKPLLKRLIGLFACPVGEEMDHVYIAWGSLAVPVCGISAVLFFTAGILRELKHPAAENTGSQRKKLLLFIILILTGLACLYLVNMLWQLDGNYFMFLYALCVICAFACSELPGRQFAILIPALLLSVCMCMTTNWAGAPGFSTPGLIHAGFLDRQQEEKNAADIAGKGTVYEVLAENPRNRVLALDSQPGCFAYPCNVQSYTDLEGNGGNVAILAHYEDFLAFLDYMQADYLYVDDAFVAERPRAYDLIRYMTDDGLIRPVASAPGAVLYVYDSQEGRSWLTENSQEGTSLLTENS